MASLFANCCGSRSRVDPGLLADFSEEAKASRSLFTPEELQHFDGNWSAYSDKTNSYIHSDKLSELTGMPPPMADIFVAAFTAYASINKDIPQVGLTKQDLQLAVAHLCKGNHAKKSFCLFRFCIANRHDDDFEDMKFRMIFPVMMCSLLYLDACAVDKKNTESKFSEFKTDAESMGALSTTLVGERQIINVLDFQAWCDASALGLLDVLGVPLERAFARDDALRPLIPVCSGRTLEGFTSNTFLTVEQMWMLNAYIPEHRQGSWEMVYSSNNDSTFPQMLETVRGLGAFVVLVKDDAGCVFGGFTSKSLPKEAGYFDDEHSFVFQLLPATTIYRYQNTHENAVYYSPEDGLGMGGEKGNMAFFIDKSMGDGHSYETETYKNGSLSTFEEFDVAQIEVWSCLGE